MRRDRDGPGDDLTKLRSGVVDPPVLSFVLESLPPPPARVLEVGAGDGALADELASAGYDVVAIDPEPGGPTVQPIALRELSAPPGSFDASVAVLSLHHIEPLGESINRLATLVRSGGTLVVDEFDLERLDAAAARWWLDERGDPRSPEEVIAHLRHHCHPLDTVRTALEEWFELSVPHRGPYLYRWDIEPALRDEEERLIAAGALPATGVRFVGTRRER